MELSPIRLAILATIGQVKPLDQLEQQEIEAITAWVASDAPLFRVKKPDVPPQHLGSYAVLYDPIAKKLLLTDHKLSGLWLPTGGHVDVDEHPRDTAARELREELGITANFLFNEPIFLNLNSAAGHIDVAFWYVFRGNIEEPLNFDTKEFAAVRWFGINEIPYGQTDSQMQRFIFKLLKCGLL